MPPIRHEKYGTVELVSTVGLSEEATLTVTVTFGNPPATKTKLELRMTRNGEDTVWTPKSEAEALGLAKAITDAAWHAHGWEPEL